MRMSNMSMRLKDIILIWVVWLFISMAPYCYSILYNICSGKLWWVFGLSNLCVAFTYLIYSNLAFLIELLLCFWIFRRWTIQKWKCLICCVGLSCVMHGGMNLLPILSHGWGSLIHNFCYRFASVGIYFFLAVRIASAKAMLNNIREQERGNHKMCLKFALAISLIDYPFLSALYALANPLGYMYLYALFPALFGDLSHGYYPDVFYVWLFGVLFSCFAYLPATIYMLRKKNASLPNGVRYSIPFIYHILVSYIFFVIFYHSGVSFLFLPYSLAALTITLCLLTVDKRRTLSAGGVGA